MASNWIKQKSWSSEDECLDAIPDDWEARQVESIYTQQDIGRRYDKKSTKSAGATPVVDQSADGFIGWHDSEPGVVATAEDPVVTFANHTCEMRLVRHPFSVIQNVFPLKGKTGDCDTRYLYYSTKGIVRLEEYKGHYPQFRERWIGLPPLSEQKAIAHILGTLDDKIELNRKTNETLEAVAKALFKSWFVDFDPVRAKAEGRPTGLPSEISDLFPDSFEDSELGEVPSGWQIKRIGEVITRLPVGKRFDQKTVLPSGSTPVLDQSAGGIVGFHNEEAGIAATRDASLFTFANHTCAMRYMIRPFSVIQNVFPLSGNGIDTAWLYQASRGKQEITEYKGHYPDFVEKQIVVPSNGVDLIYGNDYHSILLKCDSNLLESTFLASARDALLPKLISGEIRIPDAEKMLEEVGI